MKYCPNCGSKLNDGAKFCSECGNSLINYENSGGFKQKDQQPSVHVISCPRCGSPIDSFSSVCPRCGSEISNAIYASACQDLCERLDAIEASRPRETLLSTVTSIVDKVMSNTRLKPTDQQKIELISNFILPNNRSDILEFLLLADTRINACKQLARRTEDDYVKSVQRQLAEVWAAKRDQIIKKADIALGNDPDFIRIKMSIQIERYKEEGRCQYCGGSFKGMIKKICVNCGKQKDY